jgi:hypothetical protein
VALGLLYALTTKSSDRQADVREDVHSQARLQPQGLDWTVRATPAPNARLRVGVSTRVLSAELLLLAQSYESGRRYRRRLRAASIFGWR